jgi:hypothetical protein
MKLLIKLVLLAIVVCLFLFCPGEISNTKEGKNSAIISGVNNSHESVSITTIQASRDRSDDPVVKFEAIVRDMRNSNPLPDPAK